jgi:hypothetical protein
MIGLGLNPDAIEAITFDDNFVLTIYLKSGRELTFDSSQVVDLFQASNTDDVFDLIWDCVGKDDKNDLVWRNTEAIKKRKESKKSDKPLGIL